MNDEFSRNEADQIIDKNNKVIVKAIYPGCGKTTFFKNYKNQKKLFICPFNRLCQELKKDGCEAITLNKLLSIYGDGTQYVNTNEFDISNYELIIFDELYIYNINQLTRIYKYMQKHTDKCFYATGDINQ